MDALEALRTRRSVRQFSNQAVERGQIETILDCARLAATARNLQPCAFVVVTNTEKKRAVAETTDHGKFLAEAPVCIAVFSEDTTYYLEDGAAASQNILLAAHALGLGACWIAGDKKAYAPKLAQLLGVPDPHRLVSLIAVGHAAKVPEPAKKALEAVTHWEEWGK